MRFQSKGLPLQRKTNIDTMVINLIAFASMLHPETTVRRCHEIILAELEKYFTVRLVDYREMSRLKPDDFALVFIATGGVERLVIQHFEQLPRPALLLADGMQNSLAAALEISAWLQARGMKCEILHGELSKVIKRIFVLHANFKAQRRLAGSRIGVIGTPAPWLIASEADYLLSKQRWGIEYVDIPLERVCEYYRQVTDDEVGEACAHLATRALACREATPDDMLKAMRLYRAIRRIVDEDRLTGLTLSCFRLLEETDTTGCLALALLNDEGIPAACEGDLQAIFTMLAVKAMTGKESFMGNPSLVNTHTNEVVLAHCTIGLKLTDRFVLRSHFETKKGIGIQGLAPTGEVTLVKCGGECLDEYYLTTGTLTENTNYLNLCRTQVRIQLNSSADYFLKNPLGNHHIVLQGNYELMMDDFFQTNGCRRRK